MLIAHYYPGGDNSSMKRFEHYVERHKFLHNQCTKDVDLIYCGSVSQLSKAMIAKRIYKKPLVCWVWDLPYCWREWVRNQREMQENTRRTADVERKVLLLKECDKVISASKYTQRVLKEKFDIDSEQIYFYIDTDGLDAVQANGKKGHVIQISRFAINKRFDDSIKAISTLERKLVCVGTGATEELKKLALYLEADVDFYCGVERATTIKLLKEAEILVSPSVFEGWGITPIEALYCGVPVLLSDLEVFKEVYGDSVPYHKRDDSIDMREKLRYLLDDKKLQNKIVEQCRPLISEFTIPKFVERWEKAIR